MIDSWALQTCQKAFGTCGREKKWFLHLQNIRFYYRSDMFFVKYKILSFVNIKNLKIPRSSLNRFHETTQTKICYTFSNMQL